jgi:hypothetical protein
LKSIEQEIAEFNRERDEALLSMDEAVIRAMVLKHNGEHMPDDQETFWASIHKSRTAVKSLPIEARRMSKAWLDERGLSSFDEGEL